LSLPRLPAVQKIHRRYRLCGLRVLKGKGIVFPLDQSGDAPFLFRGDSYRYQIKLGA